MSAAFVLQYLRENFNHPVARFPRHGDRTRVAHAPRVKVRHCAGTLASSATRREYGREHAGINRRLDRLRPQRRPARGPLQQQEEIPARTDPLRYDMNQTPATKRTGWGRRWFALIVGVGLCLLVLSIDETDSQHSLWRSIVQFSLAFGVLALGIYEFVRHEKSKDDA